MSVGTLYVVATPIGHLDDLTPRAQSTLAMVDVIAAEDTRHTASLLRHFAINTPLVALHEHNERDRIALLLQRLQQGDNIALVSDAGTPLISDPGYPLVHAVRAAGIRVVPIPGACAAIAALSVAGLPTDHFSFIGFLPARAAARREVLRNVSQHPWTLIVYESSHRIEDCLQDCITVLGEQRVAVLARELTKQFETILSGSLASIAQQVSADPNQRKGEFVLLIAGAPAVATDTLALDQVLDVLLAELPLKQAVALAVKLTGVKRNEVYQRALTRVVSVDVMSDIALDD
ncbi:MAG: 16S rRNA (cytidine(1402)-2'-O)-methyltransferase [Gammaproteobacteria bacterium]|nr:16S rRNA (cytidine(1402)-2'-O)-methyltransferase [Gammaproteobacteria bacterium]